MKFKAIVFVLLCMAIGGCPGGNDSPQVMPPPAVEPDTKNPQEALPQATVYKHVVPLGHNCHVAVALKALKGSMARYPWDWNWSTPEIIIDNINDNFVKFLDKKRYTECKYWRQDATKGWIRDKSVREDCTGHLDYGYFFFRHHNLRKGKDYDAFKRRVARFDDLKSNSEPKLFIYAAVAEETPRQGGNWKSQESFGTGNFQFARYKDEQKIKELYDTLKKNFDNFKLLVIVNDWQSLGSGKAPYFELDPKKSLQEGSKSMDFYNLYTTSRNSQCLEYPNKADGEKFLELIKKFPSA